MNFDEQRKLAVKLASKGNAPKTLEALKDTNLCYEDILKTAVAEAGIDRVIPAILENDPSWSQYALQHIPDLGDFRSQLEERASAFSENRLAAATDAVPSTVAGIQLNLVAGVGFECWFSMFWQNPNNNTIYPQAVQPDQNQWIWSIELDAVSNNTRYYDCSYFGTAAIPIQTGATVWMIVQIAAGSLHQLTQFSSTYDPNGASINVDTKGTPSDPQFTLHGS